MAAKQIMLTAEDVKKYEEELEFLKTEKRKEIAEKIQSIFMNPVFRVYTLSLIHI